jgi:tRNA (guanine37-N1)-methyltransferase
MRIDILTIFPRMVLDPLSDSIVLRARRTGALTLAAHDIRQWTSDVHRTVDDTPYGGGAGMVMKAEPIVLGAEAIERAYGRPNRTLIMSAAGRRFDQRMARELAHERHLLLICGHYEGIDARVQEILGAEEVSIGDFVLTGGELAAAVITDAVARLLPGVIKDDSTAHESHSEGVLEYPHYTRPASFRGFEVPPVLLSGDHARIAAWRAEQALKKTRDIRPDLLPYDDDHRSPLPQRGGQ